MITTKLYLDTRRSAAGSAAPLKVSITRGRSVAYVPTGIRIAPEDWDARRQKAASVQTQTTIELKKADIDTVLLELQRKRRLAGLTVIEIRNLVMEELNPEEEAPARFLDTMRAFAASRPAPRTREIYMATVSRIEAFDPRARQLGFADISVGWLDRFDAFLAKTSPKRNARNIHLRNIRAVYNYALKRELTLHYPFRNYEIRGEETAKRSLSAEQLRSLFQADIPDWQRKYVDFFELSFLLIGMNTEDILHAEGVTNGRLEYRRAKTHRPYSIKVEPECMEILERFRGSVHYLNVLDTYACTHHWSSKVNNELKAVAGGLGLPRISMYWARHSWATIAASLDIPKETIAAALGHSSGTVTDIYINFDRNKIDLANRQVMDYVLYGKEKQNVLELLNKNMERLLSLQGAM